ncbi:MULTISPECIES: hypothetical protein [Methylobacterium]|uniref:Lipoprotein n=2 Tax=Methylobacterium TaxID=407 RepID=A0A0C6FCN0_9HYPH|nr:MULTISPECIES: hypothetical protein [Methylobacterium]BAQ44627.1 hypothetical protein Maq22A_c06380 [Methylobacterium aquaticum]SEO45853.1 hypothetical protein SAMN04487843_101461 [Methylobacterium sp. ap11]
MRRSLKLVVLAAAAALPAACAPNPIIARDPVPAPSPDIAYRCSSTPALLNGYWAECERIRREREVVIRTKG